MDLKKTISRLIPRFIQDYRVKLSVHGGLRSYSQHGEDLILDSLFLRLGIQQPDYLDIGAYHPFHLSNTALFYRKGCSGMVVDANPDFAKDFKKWRPKDRILVSGVGPQPGRMVFYRFENATLNTFSEAEKDRILHEKLSMLKQEQEVNILTLNQIVDQHFNGKFPALLSLDVEGLDAAIIRTVDFDNSFPVLICIETNGLAGEHEPEAMRRLLETKGYRQLAETGINSIFQHRSTLS